MLYRSTRDPMGRQFGAAEVIKMGLAPDGGLFVPEEIPTLTREDIAGLCGLGYAERAAKILSLYLTDYSYDELLEDCRAAYREESFPGGPAPLHCVSDKVYALELWHGPTAAFKDMALQIMPRLLSRALVKTGERQTALILVATSGDTGKAALEGYKDIPGVKIQVFYPVDGVSRVQKMQMATQLGSNVDVCAIEGNFDDAQSGVKKIFADATMREALAKNGCILSSANSINWGRLVPQIVYYVSAYCDLVNAGAVKNGDPIDFCVPTGNFGNIFAAYLAFCMGLPVGKLVCASNSNRVLTDFLTEGVYDRNRQFHLTMSPSMDILISSNLERLLWCVAGAEKTAELMRSLNETGSYRIDAGTLAKINKTIVGYSTDEAETAATIHATFAENGYLIDTHTAVGLHAVLAYLKETGSARPMVVDSTASPFKFAPHVLEAVNGQKPEDPLATLAVLSKATGVEITYPLRDLDKRAVRFSDVIQPAKMSERVLAFSKQ